MARLVAACLVIVAAVTAFITEVEETTVADEESSPAPTPFPLVSNDKLKKKQRFEATRHKEVCPCNDCLHDCRSCPKIRTDQDDCAGSGYTCALDNYKLPRVRQLEERALFRAFGLHGDDCMVVTCAAGGTLFVHKQSIDDDILFCKDRKLMFGEFMNISTLSAVCGKSCQNCASSRTDFANTAITGVANFATRTGTPCSIGACAALEYPIAYVGNNNNDVRVFEEGDTFVCLGNTWSKNEPNDEQTPEKQYREYGNIACIPKCMPPDGYGDANAIINQGYSYIGPVQHNGNSAYLNCTEEDEYIIVNGDYNTPVKSLLCLYDAPSWTAMPGQIDTGSNQYNVLAACFKRDRCYRPQKLPTDPAGTTYNSAATDSYIGNAAGTYNCNTGQLYVSVYGIPGPVTSIQCEDNVWKFTLSGIAVEFLTIYAGCYDTTAVA